MSRRTLALSATVMILTTVVAVRTLAATTCGEPAPVPRFQVGDKWTWRDNGGKEATDEVIQVEGDTTQIRWNSGDVAYLDKNRILQKVRKKNGEVVSTQGTGDYRAIGQKVMDFPLQIGKTWKYSFTGAPDSNLGTLQTYTQSYSVLSCEEVTTPAGKFSAFKIEVNQRVATRGSGGIYYFWYAP